MIYQNIERIRIAKGVTKTYIAARAGRNLQWYYRISKGHSDLIAEDLKSISDALEQPVSVFLSDELTDTVVGRLMRPKELQPTNA